METIIGARLRNSRIHKGFSLQEVAEKLNVSKQMISKYENGLSMPSSEKLIAFSKLFGQKIDYFFRKSEVEISEISFRKKSSFSPKKVNSLKEEIRIHIENYLFIENILYLDTEFKNPLSALNINSDADIIHAVNCLRNSWNIGSDPIHNIIQLMEDNNIKVIEIEDESNKFDGLATIVNEKYYVVVVNKNMPLERKRFTLLHELGHILLDLNSFETKIQEKFCNLFASEILISQDNTFTEFGRKRSSITIEELKNIQRKYGISIRAIMYKLGDLKIISQEKLTEFYKKINYNILLKNEIDDSRFKGNENSNRYENLVYRAVSEVNISLSKASSLLNISLDELKNNISININ
ncbi:MAG: XRE family transcriptional regulator [Bacteroidetes bacterium]|nr:XRE family transcriptional regulator [Bacteroidota bacterium]